jgi:hypothetical protein
MVLRLQAAVPRSASALPTLAPESASLTAPDAAEQSAATAAASLRRLREAAVSKRATRPEPLLAGRADAA